MKTKAIVFSLAVAMVLASATAEAGRRGHDGYGNAHGPARHGHVPHHRAYRHDRPYYRHGHHYRHDYHVLAGSLLLGSIIATTNRPPAGVVVSGPRVVIRQPYAAQPDVWYQSDQSGDCFEVQWGANGQQIWTQVHPANCR
jgi:hypothetical protein